MKKILLAAVGFAALAGAAGLALAQDGERHPGGHHDMFQGDTNNDGALTRQEFDAARDAHFAQMDANHDGQLAHDEMRGMRRMHGGGRHHGGPGMGGMHGADANNDGNITRDEFLARPIQMFERLDANHDGVISAAEQPQRRERAEGGEGQRRERVRPDTDGDHRLSRAEFTAMGTTMFERMDANHDGRVTREEAEASHPRHPG